MRARVIFASEKLQLDASTDIATAVEQAVARAGFSLVNDAARALLLGAHAEAAMVLLLFLLGERLEAFAAARAAA